MTDYPESGIKLVVDTASAESAVSELMSQLDEIQGVTYTATLTIEADNSEAQAAIDDLPLDGETVNFTIDTEVTGDNLDDLPLDGETVNFTVDTEVTGDNLDDLPQDGEKADFEVDTEVKAKNNQTNETFGWFRKLSAKEAWDWVIDVSGTALDFLKTVGDFSVKPMLDLGDAVAKVGARTGDAIPNADKLINKIYYSDLGKSKDEIASLITIAKGLNLPIEEAVIQALTFTHTWSEVDSQTAITTFGTLLKTNLVGNMKEASDLMATFFQQGGNKGGDALQVVNANAQSWHDMGLTAQQALSTISTLMQGNVDNASDAAKMIQTLDDSLTTAASNAKSPQAQLLKQMGLDNPKDKGQAMGADFIDGFAAAFKTMPADQQDLISGTFFGKGGKKFTGAIEEMTAHSDMFKNVKDAAELAAKEVDNSFRGAVDDFMLAAEKAVEDWLSSSAIDLPGKIEALKEGLQNALDTLAKGGTLGEALEVALKPIGFDDEFRGLESALGNFVIGILQAVAQIQEVTGHGAEAKGTRATIAGMASNQLTFDLKVANPDEVATTISTAISRGVTPEQIAKSVGTAVTELAKDGGPAAAQALLDSFKKSSGQIIFDVQGELERALLKSQGQNPTFTIPITPEMTPEDIQKTIDDTKATFQASGFFIDATVQTNIDQKTIDDLQKQLDDASKKAQDEVRQKANEARLDAADASDTITEPTKELKNSATETAPAVQTVADNTKTQGDNAGTAAPKIRTVADNTKELGTNASKASGQVADTAGAFDAVTSSASTGTGVLLGYASAIDAVTGKANALSTAADTLATKQSQQTNNTNTNTTSGPHAAGGEFIGTSIVGEQGAEIVSSNRGLSVLNNMTTENILAALQGFIPGQSIMGKTGNTYIANNNNIVNSQAEADSVGYATAKVLRGMG